MKYYFTIKLKDILYIGNFSLQKVETSTENHNCQAVVAHDWNPNTLRGRGRQISEFEASLFYRVSSRTARAIQRNPVSEKKYKYKKIENHNQ